MHPSMVFQLNLNLQLFPADQRLFGAPLGNTNVPVAFTWHVTGPRKTSAFLKKPRPYAPVGKLFRIPHFEFRIVPPSLCVRRAAVRILLIALDSRVY